MLFKKEKDNAKLPEQFSKKLDNPRVSLEFLPDGNVKPVVFWEPHSNFNAILMANVINLLNEGKLYEHFKLAIISQGKTSGDVELSNVILKHITNPKSTEDEKPIIPASMVTRVHFSQQRTQANEE